MCSLRSSYVIIRSGRISLWLLVVSFSCLFFFSMMIHLQFLWQKMILSVAGFAVFGTAFGAVARCKHCIWRLTTFGFCLTSLFFRDYSRFGQLPQRHTEEYLLYYCSRTLYWPEAISAVKRTLSPKFVLCKNNVLIVHRESSPVQLFNHLRNA